MIRYMIQRPPASSHHHDSRLLTSGIASLLLLPTQKIPSNTLVRKVHFSRSHIKDLSIEETIIVEICL